MNAHNPSLSPKLRMTVVALAAMAGFAGTARAALLAPSGLTPAVPAEYVRFIGLSWQNQQAVPTSPGGLPLLQMFGIGVYRSIDNGSWSRIALLPPAQTDYTVTSIQRERNYRFRVRLEPASGFQVVNQQRILLGQTPLNAADFTSPYSNIVNVRYERVRTPSITTCLAITDSMIQVNWTESEPGAVSSVVLVTSGNLQVGMIPVAMSVTTVDISTIDSGPLQPNRMYGFMVQSVDPYGNTSNFSTLRTRATLAKTPTDLRCMLASDGRIHVSWNDSTLNSGIQVHRQIGLGGFTQVGADLVAGTPGVALSVTTVLDLTHITVRAVNRDGIVGPFASPTTAATGPNPPANRVIVRNNSQLPLRSLRIDGMEMVVSGFDVPAAGRGTIVLPAGSHNVHASGFNNMCGRNTLEFPSAGANQAFTLSGNPVTITIPAITLRAALSQSGGMFQAADGYGDWYDFASDGSWAYGYLDSIEVIGTFSGTYAVGISSVTLSYLSGGTLQTFSAVFNECDGTLTIPVFDPSTGSWIDLVYER